MLNRVEALIRCYDPCLSCASHAFGQMPLRIELRPTGKDRRCPGARSDAPPLPPHHRRKSWLSALAALFGATMPGDHSWPTSWPTVRFAARNRAQPTHLDGGNGGRSAGRDIRVVYGRRRGRRTGQIAEQLLEPRPNAPETVTHSLDPRSLLAWTQALYGSAPPALLFSTRAGSLRVRALPADSTRAGHPRAADAARR